MTGAGTLPSVLAGLTVDDPRHPDATVLAPRDDGEVAAILRHAASADEPVTVAGSGSARREAPSPRLVISTLALDTIEHEPEDLTVVAGAGVCLGALSSVLDHHRQSAILPHGVDDRTVGGVVATGASAFERLRYGPTRDRVLGVTLVTGYGEVVRGGGRLVKNVTGFDLPRLVTGSHGALGVITSVCLKLWPRPAAARTFLVADPERSRSSVYEPSAVLETDEGTMVYVEGSPGTVDAAANALGVSGDDGLQWPEPLRSAYVLAVLVPPAAVDDVVAIVRRDADRFIAQHGVGRVEVGYDTRIPDVAGIRRKVVSLGGTVVVERWDGDGPPERWGGEPQGMVIQRRLKALFDPAGILNVGVLPGGL